MGDYVGGRWLSRIERAPLILGVGSAAIGLLALIGWVADIAFLKGIRPDFATTKPNAAIGIILLGAALAIAALSEKIRSVPRILGAAAALIGLVTILEHLTGIDAGIDAVLFTSKLEAEGSLPPGRMTFAAALSLFLLGIAVIGGRVKRRGAVILIQIFSFTAFLIALLTITEYVYNLRLVERVPILATMALGATAPFLMVSVGTILLIGCRGLTVVFWGQDSGGIMARRLVPVIVILPLFFGWFIFLLLQEGYFPAPFALALFGVGTTITLSALAWLTTASIERSEMKRSVVERKLRASHRELSAFKFALDQSAIVAITDADGCITYVNEKFTELSGYSREEAVGKTHRIVNSGYHPPEFFSEMWATITAGKIWHGEICNRAKDGRIMWVDATIVPLLDDEGKPERYIGIRFNITPRKLAEEKVAESESRYRLLFENNPYPMWVYDAESLAFLAVNDAAVEHYGYSKDEFLSMGIADIRPEEDVPGLLENVANTTAAIDSAGIWRHRRKNGSIILVEINSHELEFDGRRARLVLAHDVTDRIRAESEVRESEERYRALASSARMTWLADASGMLKKPADNWTEITGLEIRNSPDEWWLEGVHPDDRKFTLRKWRHSIATREVFEVESRVRSAEGSYRWFYSRGVPVLNVDGTVREWVGMTLDINKRKEAEAELIRLNEELEQRVAARTVELEAANTELEAFSYSVSHDLRAPLRAMDGFSHVLIEDYAGKLDATGLGHLQRIRLASQKMASLIDDLLMLSRISRRELQRRAVNLSEIARSVLREHTDAEPERNVDLCIQDGVIAYCDEHLARVALENLLGNAWKFTSKTDRAEISFGVESQDGLGEIYVRDNGAGFDMAYADKLFGAFQRLHSEGDFPGTGIGLATVKRIIMLHGGSVRAIGEPGKGAAFYFNFGTALSGR